MYSKELEELIESVIADGVVTEQERAVLRKRAQSCGEDPDEVMVVVEGRIARMKQESIRPKSEKHGTVAKCPACGAYIPGAVAKCPECGHEFRNIDANTSAKRFAAMLHDAEKEQNIVGNIGTAFFGRSKLITAIENFPVPNTTEDLYEMMATLQPQATATRGDYRGNAMYRLYAKCCSKAIGLGLENDSRFAPFIADYKKKKRNAHLPQIIAAVGLFLFMFIVFCVAKCNIDNDNKKDAVAAAQIEAQLDSLSRIITELPTPNKDNYAECTKKVMDLTWMPIDCSGSDIKEKQNKAIKTFVQRKNAYITQLNNLGVGNPLPVENDEIAEEIDALEKAQIEKMIMEQSEDLSRKISKLKTPKEKNYLDCVTEVNKLVWIFVDCKAEPELETLQMHEIEAFVQKKNAYIGLINRLGIGDTIPSVSADQYIK